MAKKNSGKKNTSTPAPPTKLTPKLNTSAWVSRKENKNREEDEARTDTRDSHPGSTVSASSSSKPATVSRRRLPFGQRLYESDCGSDDDAPEGQSDDDICINDHDGVLYDYNEHFHADESEEDDDETVDRNPSIAYGSSIYAPSQCYKKTFFLGLLQLKKTTRQSSQTSSSMRKKDLCQRVDVLEGKNRKLETTVATLMAEVKKTKEEKELAVATQVVTLPTTPRKDVAIRPVPSKTPTWVVTPLAQRVLKRNMAKRKE
ncbi:hypothetical protein BDD12DRAFT_892944 [Trichophaea hybrida]|nr:hypothetical protein BDD12DRAFT_892944 [Trichophaea hybrida]